jgi:hypothetical protein
MLIISEIKILLISPLFSIPKLTLSGLKSKNNVCIYVSVSEIFDRRMRKYLSIKNQDWCQQDDRAGGSSSHFPLI